MFIAKQNTNPTTLFYRRLIGTVSESLPEAAAGRLSGSFPNSETMNAGQNGKNNEDSNMFLVELVRFKR